MSLKPMLHQNRPLRNEIDFDSQAASGARPYQEDYALFSTNPSGSELLAVLADGMGGHSAGDVASKRAVDAFHSTFNNYPPSSVPAKLSAALNQANNDLAACVKDSPALDGMGCTLVGVHIGSSGLHWISVGDSPLFLYRAGEIKRLNADHSMVPVIEDSLRQGKISSSEALAHPDRHALRSAVSGGQIELIDSSREPVALQTGDVVILASDGLLTLTLSEIGSIVGAQAIGNAQSIVSALMKAVASKNKPKQDNTTVQVFIARHDMGKPTTSSRLSWWLIGLAVVILLGSIAYAFKGSFFEFPKLPEILNKSKVTVTPTPVQLPDSPSEPASAASSNPVTPVGSASAPSASEPTEKVISKQKHTATESESKTKSALPPHSERNRQATPEALPKAASASAATSGAATPQTNTAPAVVPSSSAVTNVAPISTAPASSGSKPVAN